MEKVDKRYLMLKAITEGDHKAGINYLVNVGGKSTDPIEWAIKLC